MGVIEVLGSKEKWDAIFPGSEKTRGYLYSSETPAYVTI